jgi:transcriptional regulator with PAS, ATPase and Fis domain
MKIEKFLSEYQKATKLAKIQLLAKQAEWLVNDHIELYETLVDECEALYHEYLEFSTSPDKQVQHSLACCYLLRLRMLGTKQDRSVVEAYADKIQPFIISLGDAIVQAEFFALLCYHMLNFHDAPQAVVYGEKAHRLIGTRQITKMLQSFYSNYGMALIYTRDFERAKEILTLGLARINNTNKTIAEKLHMHLGLLYRNLQQFDNALEEFLIARELHDSGDVSGTVILNINIAMVHLGIGHYQEVVEQLEQNNNLAASCTLDATAQQNLLQSYNVFIGCSITLQDFERASTGLAEMERLIEDFNLPEFYEDYYRLAADSACSRGDLETASMMYEKAYQRNKEEGTLTPFFYQAFINFLIFIQQFERALDLCDEALKLSSHQSTTADITIIREMKVHALKGAERYKEALLLMEENVKNSQNQQTDTLKKQIDHLIAENKKQEKQLRDKEKRISLFRQSIVQERNINFVGTSTAMKAVIEKAAIAAQHPDVNVMIVGESGTGKEVIAKYIHYSSQVDQTVFQEVNCSAIPETMLESEFFGYKKGAFTGALKDTKGFIEAAHGGTLFLDEIGDLPLTLQPKLLKVLEEKRVTPLGSNQAQDVSFRLISATNRDLNEMITLKEFRADLFNRINSLIIEIPPLRARRADILPLAQYFIAKFTRECNIVSPLLDDEAVELLLGYHYPGNVRELRNIIERSMIFVRQGLSFNEALAQHGFVYAAAPVTVQSADAAPIELDTMNLEEVEERLVRKALQSTGNHKSKAASLLGITPSSLTRRLKKFGIE